MITHVLRWNGFERVLKTEKPLHHHRIEVHMPPKITPADADSALLPVFQLWPFEFVKVDEEGRRIYDATTDPPVV